MKKNEYQCAECGGIFKKGRSDEEAWLEHDENFPGASHETTEIICDDCYQKMIAVEPPPGMRDKQEADALKLAQLAAFPPIAIEQQTDCDWFHLKLDKPWWWKLLHPIKTRKIKKWMRETEPVIKQELEKMNFEKMIFDQLIYGTSITNIGPGGLNPANRVAEDNKLIDGLLKNYVSNDGGTGIDFSTGKVRRDRIPEPRWIAMDIINTHKDIIETEIKRKEKP